MWKEILNRVPLAEPWASLTLVALSLVVATVVYGTLIRLAARWVRMTDSTLDDKVVDNLRGPLRWLLPIKSVGFVLPGLAFPEATAAWLRHAELVVIILLSAWLLMRTLRIAEAFVKQRYDISKADNLQARAIHTQVRSFRNILTFVIGVLAFSLVLMTFDRARQVGMSLLASAGVAGVVIGFAAQRTIATVIAGIQVAITQPIRVDDVVIVESEWGWIEEITLTYVVVRIWDLRRLVLPINYFIEKPFQNWTRTSADILGTVFVYVDYGAPVEEIRAELKRILDDSKLWDQKAWGLQVTNTTDRSLELRALMSAADAGKAWDLRCEVRERLVAYVEQNHAGRLPRFRAELDRIPDAA